MRVSRDIRKLEGALKDAQVALQASELQRTQLQSRLDDETAHADELQRQIDALNQQPDQLDAADTAALTEAETLLGIDDSGNPLPTGGNGDGGTGATAGGGVGGVAAGAAGTGVMPLTAV